MKKQRMTHRMVKQIRKAVVDKGTKCMLEVGCRPVRDDMIQPHGSWVEGSWTYDCRIWKLDGSVDLNDLNDRITFDEGELQPGTCLDIYVSMPECPNDRLEDFTLICNVCVEWDGENWTARSEYPDWSGNK